MTTRIKGGKIYKDGSFEANDSLLIHDGSVFGGSESGEETASERVITLDNSFILPSLCDVHVHFREPGSSYKETVKTGSLAAAKGGYTTVGTMPNVRPVPSTPEGLEEQLKLIREDAVIEVLPYGSITMEQSGSGELAQMEAIADDVIAFSDDGVGVADEGLMRAAMEQAKGLCKIIAAHCEDMELLREGKVRESEWKQIERDLKLADETGCAYHVCHISCKESVELIRDAKKSGVDVTCETAPHYLLLDSDFVQEVLRTTPELGGRVKMNPPIKEAEDRRALVEGLMDGTVDMVATDHAPHSAEEKGRGFEKSLNGITGLECAFPVLYTGLVERGILTLPELIDRMAAAPRKRFGLAENGFFVFDPTVSDVIDSRTFLSKGHSTPFDGRPVLGRIQMTVMDGKIVYEYSEAHDER